MASKNRRGELVRVIVSLFALVLLASSTQVFAQTESRTESKVESKAESKIESKVESKVEVQIEANDPDRAFAMAVRLHEAGDLEGAIRGYLAILVSYPARIDVRSNLGAAYSRLGRYEDAIDQDKRALAIDSRNLTIRFNLAMAYYKAAWFTEA